MADIGIKASIKGVDVSTVKDLKSLSWTSSLYQHGIAQTEYLVSTANQTLHHFLSYIPIVFSFFYNTNYSKWTKGDTRTKKELLLVSSMNNIKIRYYLFFQNV